jgi:O-antigen/teichoic acid export membrane protein
MSSVKKNLFYNVILSVSQVLFPLIIFSHVARIIEPTGIGKVSFVESICRYAILIAALGIPIYGIRESAKLKENKTKLSELFFELITIHFLSTLLISILYISIVFSTSKLNVHLDYYLFGLVLIFSNILNVEWFFQGIEDFKFITIRTAIIRLVATILVFIFITKPEHTFRFFLFTVFTSAITSMINLWYANKHLTFKLPFNFKTLKKHYKPLLLIFSTTISISVYVLLDTIMLGFLSDEKAVGFYSIALKISKIPMLFVGALGLVLIPQLSFSYHQKSYDRFNILITKSINFVITFSFPLIFFIISLSDHVIYVFAGEEFVGASMTLKILSILILFLGLSNVFGMQILTPIGKDKYLTISVLCGMAFSISLNFILIPIYHEVGAAVTNVITEIIVTGATLYFANKYVKINFSSSYLVKSLMLSIPYYFISFIISSFTLNSIYILIFTFIISAIYFFITQVYILKNELIIDLKNYFKLKIWPNTII